MCAARASSPCAGRAGMDVGMCGYQHIGKLNGARGGGEQRRGKFCGADDISDVQIRQNTPAHRDGNDGAGVGIANGTRL